LFASIGIGCTAVALYENVMINHAVATTEQHLSNYMKLDAYWHDQALSMINRAEEQTNALDSIILADPSVPPQAENVRGSLGIRRACMSLCAFPCEN
jgi:hypothetical protein